MTIRPLISNPSQPVDAPAPAGLPDVAGLAQLANAFFASLPGGALVRPGAPSGDLAPAVSTAQAREAPPAGIADGLDLGSPEAYAAALPSVFPSAGGLAPSAGGAPSSPYYFLGEGSAHAGEPQRFAEVPVEPDSLAVPGVDVLGEILRSILAEPSAPAAPAGQGAGSREKTG